MCWFSMTLGGHALSLDGGGEWRWLFSGGSVSFLCDLVESVVWGNGCVGLFLEVVHRTSVFCVVV